MKQYDIFGNAEEVVLQTLRGRKKYTTMQELHGIKEGEICKTCKHCIAYGHNRTYYKCELWIKSSSAATDIRLKNKACNKWEAKGGEEE